MTAMLILAEQQGKVDQLTQRFNSAKGAVVEMARVMDSAPRKKRSSIWPKFLILTAGFAFSGS
jgi:hypothetical protein